MIPHLLGTMFDWPNGIVLGNLLASAMWATPALFHLHRKLNRNHAAQMAAASAHAPVPGRKHTMKLLVDVEQDAQLIRQRLGDVVPEIAQDALDLGRTLAGRWLTGGLSPADLSGVLRQVAAEVEQQVIQPH